MKDQVFKEKELALGRKLLLQGGVKSKVFSEGTYQIEVVEDEQVFWPFLQITDEGELLDFFCSCSEPVACSHLAGAYLSLFRDDQVPLHKRFKDSFWNRLCHVASHLHGYRADTLIRYEDRWEARSVADELIFFIRPLTVEGSNKIRDLLDHRVPETEETSLKFSNLSEEEIKRWKQGNPTKKLRYELSFWSDLAKYFFAMQEEKKPYKVQFFPEGEVPSEAHVSFEDVLCVFKIERDELPYVIPSLRTIDCPLCVYEAEELSVQGISYDPQKRGFSLSFTKKEADFSLEKAVEFNGWKFIPNKGFFHQKIDPLFTKEWIEESSVEIFLSKHASLIRRYLPEKISDKLLKPQYTLYFTKEEDLCVEIFLFKEGDLSEPLSSLFGRWAYLPGQGFFFLAQPLFSCVRTVIKRSAVSDFVETHKIWLGGIEGFKTHLMSIESSVSYEVEKGGDLLFVAHMDIIEEDLRVIDLGDWIFVATRGFFPKKKEGIALSIFAGKRVLSKDMPLFLRLHKEELKLLPHFFAQETPIDKVSLRVAVEKNRVHVKPVFLLKKRYVNKEIFFYREYAFLKGEGFSCLPPSLVPSFLIDYLEEKTLSYKEEAFFLSHLKQITPWIEQIDERLKAPEKLVLSLQEMKMKEKSGWLLDLHYETEIGSVSVREIWQGLQDGREFLFSSAGLLDLSSARWQWLRSLRKKSVTKAGKISLSALEWIRLQTVEAITLPEGDEERQKKTKEIFTAFSAFQGFLPLSTEGLKSTLRPYQETGLKWLWFLYCYGLSGLLCDEMGLGKTHQAMGLMAAVSHVKKEGARFLVVCPTSVIYHWEELLKRFLPHLRVHVFYGQGRRVQGSLQEYDVLLTSYGIVRTEKKKLSEFSFEVAIYDEIQHAKNPHSQTHKALKNLQTKVAIGLTGTPIENRITELKSLLDLILPHYLPSEAQFKEHFVIPIERDKDPYKKELLSKIVHPFILRRKKTEVLLELPAKTEEIAYCDLSPDQKKLYQELVFLYKEECKKEIHKGRSLPIFALFSKLKQVCDHPCLLSKTPEQYTSFSSGKWDLFVELLEEARQSGQKVVVFTQYLCMMDIIKLYLTENGVGFAEIRGSTRDRRAPLKRFKEDPECQVFVASLQAAGVGIDLTAASVVIHYDRWWNPAKENQATDRVHRIGQNVGVQVFKLVTKRTIEERIHELILKKTDLLEEIVGFDDQEVVKILTNQEIFEIFSSLEEDLK